MSDQFISILQIEENHPTHELYRRKLSRHFECESEKEALALLDNNLFKVIVLEPTLQSGGQGWSLLAMLHEKPQTRDIPVILCSTLDQRKRGFELGATMYLTKPV